MQKNIRKISLLNVILFIALAVYTVMMFSILIWALLTSFKSAHAFYVNPLGLPNPWTLDVFKTVMQYNFVRVTYSDGVQADFGLLSQLFNTILYAGVGTLVSVMVPCITAYLCAKYRFFFNKIVTTVVIITMILPIVGSYSSELRILKGLGIYDQIWGNWIQKANPLGIYFLVFKAFFAGMSDSYIEAARIDGASELRILLRIVLPLSIKTISTVYLVIFVANWNDYQTPLLYLPSWPTLAVGIFKLSRSSYNDLSSVPAYMAGCIILTVPIVILFLVFHKKLMGNLSVGGVKE